MLRNTAERAKRQFFKQRATAPANQHGGKHYRRVASRTVPGAFGQVGEREVRYPAQYGDKHKLGYLHTDKKRDHKYGYPPTTAHVATLVGEKIFARHSGVHSNTRD